MYRADVEMEMAAEQYSLKFSNESNQEFYFYVYQKEPQGMTNVYWLSRGKCHNILCVLVTLLKCIGILNTTMYGATGVLKPARVNINYTAGQWSGAM